MTSLAEQIRRRRESRLQIGKHTFVIRRPTALQWAALRPILGDEDASVLSKLTAMLPFVVGWADVTEGDLVNGAPAHPAQFDAEALSEWLQDDLSIAAPVIQGIVKAYQDSEKKTEDAAGN
jgi:hypothetical protein